MVLTDFSGNFVNYESTEDGDIVEIIGEAVYVEKDFGGQKKMLLDVPVKKNGKEMIYSPNNSSGKVLSEAFGRDSKDWIGQKFEVLHIDKKLVIRALKTTSPK